MVIKHQTLKTILVNLGIRLREPLVLTKEKKKWSGNFEMWRSHEKEIVYEEDSMWRTVFANYEMTLAIGHVWENVNTSRVQCFVYIIYIEMGKCTAWALSTKCYLWKFPWHLWSSGVVLFCFFLLVRRKFEASDNYILARWRYDEKSVDFSVREK